MTKATALGAFPFCALAVVLTLGATTQPSAHVPPQVEKATVNGPVTLTDNGDS